MYSVQIGYASCSIPLLKVKES